MPDIILAPNAFLLLVASVNQAYYPSSIGLSNFPSLNNTGDQIILYDANTKVIDSISYTDQFYRDSKKKDGGYSLERISFSPTCTSQHNWMASLSLNGGSPGFVNSVFNQPFESLQFMDYSFINDSILQLNFNQYFSFSWNQLNEEALFSKFQFSGNSLFLSFKNKVLPNYLLSLKFNSIFNCVGDSFSFT